MKTLRIAWLLPVCCVAFISSSFAVDLVSSYQHALSYNADYLKAIATSDANQEFENQGKAALLPQFNFNAAMTENYLNAGFSIFYHQAVMNAQLQQTILDFSKFSTYTKSLFATELAHLQLKLAKQQLMLDVTKAYLNVLYANDTLNTIKITKDSMEQALKKAQLAFQAGTVTIADVNDARSGFDTAQAKEIEAKNDLLNSKVIFHNLTGLSADLIQPLQTKIILTNPYPQNIESWVNKAMISNINVQVSQKEVEMAKEDFTIARSKHLPVMNLVGTYQYFGDAEIDGSSVEPSEAFVLGSLISSYSVAAAGVQVKIPIYSGGGISSSVRQMMHTYEQNMEKLSATKRQAGADVRNAYWQVRNGVSLIQAQTQALKSAKLKLKSDHLGYTAGVRNSINVVNSEKMFYTAIQNYNQARYQYLSSRLQLDYLAGKISESTLAVINANIAQ